jgi:hypothetical protein
LDNPLLQNSTGVGVNPLLQANTSVQNPLTQGRTFQKQSDNRVARGVDLLQATVGAAIQSGGEIVGYDDAVEAGKAIRVLNEAEADQEAKQADGIMEGIVEAVPSIGAVLGAGAVGLAVAGPVGGLVGLGLASFGLNLGTVKEIQESMGDFSEAGGGSAGVAALATVPDILSAGVIGQAAVAPIKQAVKNSVVKNVAKGVGIEGGASGVSQGILDVGANIDAGIDIDQDRLEAIANNVGLATAIGGGLGGLGGGAVSGINKLRATQDAYDQYLIDVRDGVRQPNPVSAEGVMSLPKQGVTRVFGTALAPVQNYVDNLKGWDKIGASTYSDPKRRALNIKDEAGKPISARSTVGEELQGRFRADVSRFNKLDKDTQNKAFAEIAEGRVTSAEAKSMVKLFDNMVAEAADAGITVKRADKFLPLSQDIKKITANKADYEADMLSNARAKLSGDELKQFEAEFPKYLEDLINNGGEPQNVATRMSQADEELIASSLTGNKESLAALRARAKEPVEKLRVNKSNSLELGRFLSVVDQAVLEKWADKSVSPADRMQNYIASASERISWAKAFGVDGEILNKRVMEGIVDAADRGIDVPPSAIKRVYDVANAMQRQYKTIENPKIRNLNKSVRTYQYLRTLPSALLSSLVEPFIIAEGIGSKSAMTGIGKAVKQAVGNMGTRISGRTSVKQADLTSILNDHNVSMQSAYSHVAQRMDADSVNFSKFEGGLFKWNGLAAWTEFNRSMAAFTADDALKAATKKLVDGNLSKKGYNKAARKLEEAGVSVEDARAAYDVNTGQWKKDSEAYTEVKRAGINLINDVVLKPDAANRPLWQSDPRLALVAQLKGWTTVFGNTVMTRWADKVLKSGAVNNFEQAAKLVTFVSMYMMGLMGQMAIKDVAKDGDFEMDEKDMSQLVMDAAGQVGPVSYVTDTVGGGKSGGTRTALGFIGGPTGTQGVDAVNQVSGVLNGTVDPEVALREIMLSLTMPNVPMVGAARDLMREALQ